MRRFDFIIILIILFGAAASLAVLHFTRDDAGARFVEIYEGSTLTRTMPLDEDAELTIETNGGYNRVRVEDGRVRISEADCQSQTCVHSGAKQYPGEVIACLPHRLLVKISGETSGEAGIDAVAY